MKTKFLIVFGIIFILFSCNYVDKSKQQSFLPNYKGEWSAPPQKTPSKKTPDGAIAGNGDVGFVLGGDSDSLIFYFSKNDFWKAQNGYPDGGVCYIGQLHISSPSFNGANYKLEQTIADATVRGHFDNNKGAFYKMNAWCAATQNITVIELEAGDEAIDFSVKFISENGMNSENSNGQDGAVNWYIRKFNSPTLEWHSAVAVAMKLSDGNSNISLKKGEKASIILSFQTNHEKDDYKTSAVEMIKELTPEDVAKLYTNHTDWWAKFWSVSQVSLGDTVLEKYYYGSQYLLASCSRNTSFPPGLWGNSLTMDATFNGWAGDYHTNYNYQAPWWAAYSSNHIALTDPYDTPILEYMDKAKEHARDFLDKQGVYYPVGIGPKGFCSSMFPLTSNAMMKNYATPETGIEGGYMFLGQKSNALFCTANMFMRFYHTYDKEYAKKVYPFMLEVADFWEDYFVFENGRYVSYNDNFWEVGPWDGKDYKESYGDINPTVTLGLAQMFFKGIIEVSTFLEMDANRHEKWKHILANMSKIPTVEIDGAIRIKACEGGNGSGSRTAPGFGRVMMHGLLYPSGACGVITDSAFAKILCDEIYRWDTDTVRYQGMKDANWNNLTGGFETYFTSAARVGYDGNKLLEKLKERIFKTNLPNLWVTQAGGGVETLSGIPSCINEMLLQSYEGVIRLFPVWPKEKDAAFVNLRAHGAFVMSSSLKNGNIESVKIISEQGRACKIENPWKGKKCLVVREDGTKEPFDGLYFELKTSPNEVIKLYRM